MLTAAPVTAATEPEHQVDSWDIEFRVPVLVIGGGACGAVAALAARSAGADVLLVERDAAAKGTTALSQGLICAAGTRAQRDRGVEDSARRLYDDILAKTRGQTDPVLARAIAEQSGPTMDWLVAEHDLPYVLDERFRAAYGHSVKRVHGWPGHGGEDLLGLLHARLAESGCDVLTRARLVALVRLGAGGVAGVVLERPDGTREVVGCDALVLASGGFGADAAAVASRMPELASATYNGHDGSTGDGIRLGAELGGALADMSAYQGYGMLTDPQGVTVPPGFAVEGGILVGSDGCRFVNETDDIAGLVHPVLSRPGGVAWLIYDQRIEALCDHIPESQALLRINAARQAGGITALAERIGIPAAALERAVGDAWAAASAGTPDPVGRSWDLDRPPQAPFRALRVRGALYHTQGGLQVDASTRVLRPDGTPLPNVFAGGGAARGVSGPSYWGYLPAMGLCAAVTLGRLAGQSAAALALGPAAAAGRSQSP